MLKLEYAADDTTPASSRNGSFKIVSCLVPGLVILWVMHVFVSSGHHEQIVSAAFYLSQKEPSTSHKKSKKLDFRKE